MSYSNPQDTPPLTLEVLNDIYRKAVREQIHREMLEWIATLDSIPYTVSPFITGDKAIWIKETEYNYAFIGFATEADAQALSKATGKPLIDIRTMPSKPWPRPVIPYTGLE